MGKKAKFKQKSIYLFDLYIRLKFKNVCIILANISLF